MSGYHFYTAAQFITRRVSTTGLMLVIAAAALVSLSGCETEESEPTRVVEVDVSEAQSALVRIQEGANECVTLFAGQTIESGKVCITLDNETDTSAECGVDGAKGSVYIDYQMTGGWELVEAHLAAGTSLSDIPTNNKGNPKIGNFPYHSGDITGAQSYRFTIPLCEFGLDASFDECDPTDAIFAAHASVRKENGDGTFRTETGWGDGDPFVAKGSWAEYFKSTLECFPQCIPGFDDEAFEQSLDEIDGATGEVGLKVFHQGAKPGQPYFRGQLDYDHDGIYEQVGLPMYCIDLSHTIASNKNYCSRLYSSYDDVLPADVRHPENLDLVNYIMNNYAIGDLASNSQGFTGGDFQRAFWSLIYGQLPSAGAYSSGPSSDVRVNELLSAAAANGEGFEPPCDGVVATLIYPVLCDDPDYTITGQVLVAQLLVTEFEGVCTVCEEEPDVGEGCETAFAKSGNGDATCFIDGDFDGDGNDDGFSRWGWSNGPIQPGSYSYNIYAAAGQCDTGKGTLVGSLSVDYDGSTARVAYDMLDGYLMTETHLYIGSEPLARSKKGDFTVAPGQYGNIHTLDDAGVDYDSYQLAASGDVYVVAHAVVCSDSF